jgi:chemotaxis protein CheD
MNSSLARPAMASADRPPKRPGFENVGRFWDSRHGLWTVQLMAGELYVGDHHEVLTTVLGSCISACVRDPVLGLGGMNHFMLPARPQDGSTGAPERYGAYALERLITELIKLRARRERLEVKVFGGGRMLGGMADVGQMNIDFVRGYLRAEGLTIVAEDVGDACARQVRYHPDTGQVKIRRLWTKAAAAVTAREAELRQRLAAVAEKPGKMELF